MGYISRLKCDLNFGLPVLIVIGIIYSLWASSYFFIAVSYSTGIYSLLLDSSVKNTYYLLCLSTSVMLYNGFKNCDKKLIQYWYLLKLAECGLINTGVVLFVVASVDRCWPFILVAIPILSAGWYITTTVQQGYRDLGVELDPISISNIFKNLTCSNQNQDSLPPYETLDDKIQENLNPLAKDTLRFWGFIKIFEFVIISPGIVLIIISTNFSKSKSGSFYNYWNIFWMIAGLGLCFTLCIRIVWKMIPKKSSGTKETEELVVDVE